MKTLVPLALIAVLALGCGADREAAGPADSGVRGVVLLGPSCPVVQENVPCPDQPFEATIRVLDPGSSDVVATTSSGKDGRFVVRLAPGRYVLEGVSPGEAFPFAKPVDVTVRPHAFTSATVAFDTGIR
ncbi:MAG: hypothetical protein WD027_09390 [Gaiellales bacterium]